MTMPGSRSHFLSGWTQQWRNNLGLLTKTSSLVVAAKSWLSLLSYGFVRRGLLQRGSC
jgi:hypothetical protein